MRLRRLARALIEAGRPEPAPAPAAAPEGLRSWTCEDLGLPAHATLRCLLHLPPLQALACGSDVDMVLWRAGHFMPFPFPAGARREARRVEAMALHEGVLHVATQTSIFTWPLEGLAAGRGRPSDGRGGLDDLRALHASGGRLYLGWSTHLEGGEGPPACISFATGWAGRVFAGTVDGLLVEVDGAPLRRFERGGRPRPVRHLAFWDGALHVAAAGALHRFDGERWTEHPGEPTALHVDGAGRLWALGQGCLWRGRPGGGLNRVTLPLERPWSLGSTPGRLWIGCRGGLVALDTRTSP